MSGHRSIAVAQTCPVRGDLQANLEQHLKLARLAAAGGAEVVIFPELSLTGYELDLAGDLALEPTDARLVPLRNTARGSWITIIAGAPVRLGGTIYIGALIALRDGTLRVYTKHHLGAFSAAAAVDGVVPPAESTVFAPGVENPLVPLGERLAAVAVCADVSHPSHAAAAEVRGATAYLASMFVIPSAFERETAMLRQRAMDHGMMVAMANYGGATGGLAAAGRSSIWNGWGELVAQLTESGPGLAIARETDTGWSGMGRMMRRVSRGGIRRIG